MSEQDHEHEYKSAATKPKSACLKCGLPENMHSKILERPEIHIYFAGKLWKFKSWNEAREKGFYLG